MTRGFGAVHKSDQRCKVAKTAYTAQSVAASILISDSAANSLQRCFGAVLQPIHTPQTYVPTALQGIARCVSASAHRAPSFASVAKRLATSAPRSNSGAGASAAAAAAAAAAEYKANLKQRQIAAREWIAPWLVCS